MATSVTVEDGLFGFLTLFNDFGSRRDDHASLHHVTNYE